MVGAIVGLFGIMSSVRAANIEVHLDWANNFYAKNSAGEVLSTSGTTMELGWFNAIPANWSSLNRSNLADNFVSVAQLDYLGAQLNSSSRIYNFSGDYVALDANPDLLNQAFLVIKSGISQLGVFSWVNGDSLAFNLPRDPATWNADLNDLDTSIDSGLPSYFFQMRGLVGSATTSGIQLASASGAVTSSQSITFGAIPSKSVGDSFVLSATATSTLPVTYTSSNPAVATVSGNTVTIVGSGSVVITASQSGNSSFAPATDVTQTITSYATTALRVASLGTPVLNAAQTSVTHTFVGNPNATYTIEYKNDLSAANWTAITAQTGANGTFSATFTSSGDYVNAWKNRMFFRAKNS